MINDHKTNLTDRHPISPTETVFKNMGMYTCEVLIQHVQLETIDSQPFEFKILSTGHKFEFNSCPLRDVGEAIPFLEWAHTIMAFELCQWRHPESICAALN